MLKGDGQINLKAEIEILKEIGYDKTVSLELFNQEWWRRTGGNAESRIRKNQSLFENSD